MSSDPPREEVLADFGGYPSMLLTNASHVDRARHCSWKALPVVSSIPTITLRLGCEMLIVSQLHHGHHRCW